MITSATFPSPALRRQNGGLGIFIPLSPKCPRKPPANPQKSRSRFAFVGGGIPLLDPPILAGFLLKGRWWLPINALPA